MRSAIVILSLLVSNSVFAEEDTCDGVLERAAANISYRYGSATSASTQANALCDERYDRMSSAEQQGLDASYKLFSASYSSAGSSFKEYRSKYCSYGRSSFFSTSQSTEYSSQVYDASVAAWRDCKAMQSANVIISPVRTPDDRSVTVSIAYRGAGTARLTGVRISPKGSFSCIADGGKNIFGPINQQLSGDSFSFDCTRSVQPGIGPGGFSADAASITVTTSATTRPFMLYFPAVANPDIRTDNANQLRKFIGELNSRVNNIFSTLQERDNNLGSSIQTLQGDLAGRASILWKGDNNGTVSCQTYCFDSKWGGYSAQCVTAVLNNAVTNCYSIPNTPIDCLCVKK
ncbi:MAG: hypothetical protein RR487_08200 [Acinetobacter sp.]